MADKKKGQDSKKGTPRSAGKRRGRFEVFDTRTRMRKLRNVLLRQGPQDVEDFVNSGQASLGMLRQIAEEQTRAGRRAREIRAGMAKQ